MRGGVKRIAIMHFYTLENLIKTSFPLSATIKKERKGAPGSE